jgi:DnaK suppressor protein
MAENASTTPASSAAPGSDTEKILATRNPSADSPSIAGEWRPFYDRLLRLRDRLIDQHTDLSRKAREIQPDALQEEPSEIGSDTFHRDYALGMMSTAQEFLTEVEAALRRIETGGYGVCELTGKPIPLERLDAVPWTRYSVEGQREIEERGEAITAGIGPLGNADRRGTEPPGPRREEEGSL